MVESPIVSVIIPVYNVDAYLQVAINSIINQSFSNLELILVDDGSEDDSLSICKSFQDARIKILINDENKGLAYSLNKGMRQAKGKYIARMDGDDIAQKDRLKTQVEFLDKNPNVGLVGTWMRSFGASNFLKKYPENITDCRIELLFEVPVGHPSVMFRLDLVEKFDLFYNEEYETYGEDYDLWIRFSHHTDIANIGIPLLQYRTYQTSNKRKDQAKRQYRADLLRGHMLNSLEIPLSTEELNVHLSLSSPLNSHDGINLQILKEWIRSLDKWNIRTSTFEKARFNKILLEKTLTWCYLNPSWESFQFFVRHKPQRAMLLVKFVIKLLKL